MLDALIYDRTLEDIAQKTAKGYYNYGDINRIESWCEEIASVLNTYNYFVTIQTKTNWTRNDFLTAGDINRIKANIDLLKSTYYVYLDTPTLSYGNNMDYVEANKIEKILYDLDSLLNKMIASFRKCGTFFCGEMGGLN